MELPEALGKARADAASLHLMTNRCLRQMSGAQFRALLEAQAEQLSALTGALAECQRKLRDSDAGALLDGILSSPSNLDMVGVVHSEFGLEQLRIENQILTGTLRTAEALCRHDIVLASLLHVWIDETRRRAWVLFDATRDD